ncbi:hypothetical protein [Arthrobacter silvisoli]|uniref:hypothetical protein n=1 Tax=Arthrobacter silvisoli TaxID=2291022 RepID=UPI001443A2B2|nr:hypothetical protein [Arthrobacter silvisoli]
MYLTGLDDWDWNDFVRQTSEVVSDAAGWMGYQARPDQPDTLKWEMARLYEAGRLGDTTFVENGREVPNPFTKNP